MSRSSDSAARCKVSSVLPRDSLETSLHSTLISCLDFLLETRKVGSVQSSTYVQTKLLKWLTQGCHFNDFEWLSKIFNDTKHRAASLRQLSFLYCCVDDNRGTGKPCCPGNSCGGQGWLSWLRSSSSRCSSRDADPCQQSTTSRLGRDTCDVICVKESYRLV